MPRPTTAVPPANDALPAPADARSQRSLIESSSRPSPLEPRPLTSLASFRQLRTHHIRGSTLVDEPATDSKAPMDLLASYGHAFAPSDRGNEVTSTAVEGGELLISNLAEHGGGIAGKCIVKHVL